MEGLGRTSTRHQEDGSRKYVGHRGRREVGSRMVGGCRQQDRGRMETAGRREDVGRMEAAGWREGVGRMEAAGQREDVQ